VQAVKRFVPLAAIDQVVPFRDQVIDRASGSRTPDYPAGMTKRDTAVHAASNLARADETPAGVHETRSSQPQRSRRGRDTDTARV